MTVIVGILCSDGVLATYQLHAADCIQIAQGNDVKGIIRLGQLVECLGRIAPIRIDTRRGQIRRNTAGPSHEGGIEISIDKPRHRRIDRAGIGVALPAGLGPRHRARTKAEKHNLKFQI